MKNYLISASSDSEILEVRIHAGQVFEIRIAAFFLGDESGDRLDCCLYGIFEGYQFRAGFGKHGNRDNVLRVAAAKYPVGFRLAVDLEHNGREGWLRRKFDRPRVRQHRGQGRCDGGSDGHGLFVFG